MKRLIALSLVCLAVAALILSKTKVFQDRAAVVSVNAKAEALAAGSEVKPAAVPHISLTPAQQQQVIEKLVNANPKAEIKQLRERQLQEFSRYDVMAESYERAARIVRARVLSTPDPTNDRKLQLMNEALKKKLDALMKENERVNRATAEFNSRLIAIANRTSQPAGR